MPTKSQDHECRRPADILHDTSHGERTRNWLHVVCDWECQTSSICWNIALIPIETLGDLIKSSKHLMKTLAQKMVKQLDIDLATATNRLRQRIVFEIQKFVGAALEIYK